MFSIFHESQSLIPETISRKRKKFHQCKSVSYIQVAQKLVFTPGQKFFFHLLLLLLLLLFLLPLSLLFCFLKASVSRFISFSFPPSHVLPSLSSSALCSSSSHRETMRRSSHQVAPFSLTWKHLGARRRRRRRRLRRVAEAALTSFFLSFISPAFFFFLFLFRTKFDVHTCGVTSGDAFMFCLYVTLLVNHTLQRNEKTASKTKCR